MTLPIRVRAYSGYRADERPTAVEIDGVFRPVEVVESWRTPVGEFFRVRIRGQHRPWTLAHAGGVWTVS